MPLLWIQLSVSDDNARRRLASPRRRLSATLTVQMTITIPADASVATDSPPSATNTSTDGSATTTLDLSTVFTKIALSDTEALAKALGVNVTVSAAPVMTNTTEIIETVTTRIIKITCPKGYYCSGSFNYACPTGSYNPLTQQTSSQSCYACPAFSWTVGEASVNATECRCSSPTCLPSLPVPR